MAKTSMIERDLKRAKLAKKYAAKRAELKAVVLSATATTCRLYNLKDLRSYGYRCTLKGFYYEHD